LEEMLEELNELEAKIQRANDLNPGEAEPAEANTEL